MTDAARQALDNARRIVWCDMGDHASASIKGETGDEVERAVAALASALEDARRDQDFLERQSLGINGRLLEVEAERDRLRELLTCFVGDYEVLDVSGEPWDAIEARAMTIRRATESCEAELDVARREAEKYRDRDYEYDKMVHDMTGEHQPKPTLPWESPAGGDDKETP